jgi:hypothetical protein
MNFKIALANHQLLCYVGPTVRLNAEFTTVLFLVLCYEWLICVPLPGVTVDKNHISVLFKEMIYVDDKN